jgi:hypothetical protein
MAGLLRLACLRFLSSAVEAAGEAEAALDGKV